MHRDARKRITRVAQVAIPVVALATVSGSAEGSTVLPAPGELVPNTVMRVSHVPDRLGAITKAEFHHALAIAAAGKRSYPAPRPGGPGYERLEHTALSSLLETVWIKGQAAEMNIVVTLGQVRRELALIKEENFRSGAEFRRFLRRWRFTRRDVYERVELQIISTRIQRRIEAKVRHRSEEQAVFDEFVKEFNERWRSRTVCAAGYVTDRCSNGPR